MKVVEIFNSIEGEGKRAGLPATFIRLFGCNLRCTYCDSMYAVEGKDYTEMSVDEIISKVAEIGCPSVTVTGGEPLIHEGIKVLLGSLCKRRYWVNVETNGSIIPTKFDDNLFYTIDYKTNSSGMSDRMNDAAFECLRDKDVLKFVVGSVEDLNQSLEVYSRLFTNPQVYISPVFGSIEPKQIVEFILEHKLWDWKVQLQLHKFIWEPDRKGV